MIDQAPDLPSARLVQACLVISGEVKDDVFQIQMTERHLIEPTADAARRPQPWGAPAAGDAAD